jgi:hypothetical protein
MEPLGILREQAAEYTEYSPGFRFWKARPSELEDGLAEDLLCSTWSRGAFAE